MADWLSWWSGQDHNTFMLTGLFYLSSLNKSITYIKDVWLVFSSPGQFLSVWTHKWVFLWLQIMDSVSVIEWDLFR